MTSAGKSRSVARYGSRGSSEKNSGSWTNKALVLIFVAIFIALIFFGFRYFQEKERVNAQVSIVTQEVLSDDSTRVWVDVTRNHTDENKRDKNGDKDEHPVSYTHLTLPTKA